jgi:hypothetical protein
MQTGIDWELVRVNLDRESWEESPDDSDYEERREYLGSVFSLYPSGKFYTPFARSNVSPCLTCLEIGGPCSPERPCVGTKGLDPSMEEGHCEICRDQAYREALESEAESQGLYVTSGEGDPCDLFAVESREKPECVCAECGETIEPDPSGSPGVVCHSGEQGHEQDADHTPIPEQD